MLYKAVAIILSTLLLAAVQMSSANAGGCHRGGGFNAYQASLNQSYLQKQRARQAAQAKAQSRAIAAARQKKAAAVQQARAEKAEQAKTEKVAAAETSNVKDTSSTTVDGPENELAVASVEQTCTRFVAEIGTTVPVSCTKQ